jgi:orotate phosphoribosyltransferase-like protein
MIDQQTATRYRSLSSIARVLLPRAEKMHKDGMTWRQIAQELRISYSALHIWRKLGNEDLNA